MSKAKKKNKGGKVLDFADFQKEFGATVKKTSLPTAPGQQVNRGYQRRQGGSSRYGNNNRDNDRDGPQRSLNRDMMGAKVSRPSRRMGSGMMGSGSRFGGSSFSRDRDNDRPMRGLTRDTMGTAKPKPLLPRTQNYAKPAGSSFEFNRNKMGKQPPQKSPFSTNSSAPSRSLPDRKSFGIRRQEPNNSRSSSFGTSAGPIIDRKSFGTKQPSESSRGLSAPSRGLGSWRGSQSNDRPVIKSKFDGTGSGFGSSDSSSTTTKNKFDGSSSGFGADLVQDVRQPRQESFTSASNRVNYFSNEPTVAKTNAPRFKRPEPVRDLPSAVQPTLPKQKLVWGKVYVPPKKTVTKNKKQLEEEEERKNQKLKKERQEQEERERKKREEEQKQKELEEKQEQDRLKKEEERSLKEDIMNFIENRKKDPSYTGFIITLTHVQKVLQNMKFQPAQAEALGQGLALSLQKFEESELTLCQLIHFLPENNTREIIILSTLSELKKIVGEKNLKPELEAQEFDIFNVLESYGFDEMTIHSKLRKCELQCLLPISEADQRLDQAFADNIGLQDLHELLKTLPDKEKSFRRVMTYIFDNYFKNPDNIRQYFKNCFELFEFLTPNEKFAVVLIDAIVHSWHEHSSENPEILKEVFGHLLENFLIGDPTWFSLWNDGTEFSPVKQAAKNCKFQVGKREMRFIEWIDAVESLYAHLYDEEEEVDYY